MSFATPSKVAALFRDLDLTASGAVTEAEVQEWLDSEHEFIKGKIGTLYQLPITQASSPLSVTILADIEAMLVAARVDDILNTYSEADKKPNWEKRAMTKLKEYVPDKDKDGKQNEPTVKLPDATYLGTRAQRAKPKFSSGNNNSPTFVKGSDNW